MFCHQCGSGVSDGAAVCGSCGADLRSKSQGDTQPIPPSDATIRIATPAEAAPGGGHEAAATPEVSSRPLPPTTVMTAVDPAAIAKPPMPTGSSAPSGPSAPLVLLFGAAVLLGVAGWGAYQWSVGRSAAKAAAAAAASAASATTAAANAASGVVTAATSAAADVTAAVTPAAAPVEPPVADPTAATAAAATAVQPPATGPGSGPALLAAARKERDAAIAQRDAALEQIKQLNSDLTRARAAAAPATPAPAVSPASASDATRLAQLQKDHDTVRYVVGSRKQLLADKVIESHLYLLPPPANLTQISLSQTTEITLDAKAYGVNNVKNVVVMPSSVWENTDYKISTSGSTVTFTILRPDAFRSFARYFVIMIE
jgi:hypothetical protein